MVTEGADLGLLLVPAFGGGSVGGRDPRAATQAAVDGFVVYSMSDEEPLLAAALERGLPTVVVDQPARGGVPFVGVDDEAAARETAGHLLELGHERLGVVSFGLSPDGREGVADLGRQEGAAFRVSRLRLRGYRSAAEDADVHWSGVPVYECQGSTTALGRRAAGALLSPEKRPTAVLCTSDQLALGVLAAAWDLGLSVPEDLSVVGFDDVPPGAVADPPLTTVHQDHAEKGSLAGRMLVSLLGGERDPEPVRLPTRMVIRASTAPPR